MRMQRQRLRWLHSCSQLLQVGRVQSLAVKQGKWVAARRGQQRLRVRRITTPHWLVWQVQDEGSGLPPNARAASLPEQPEALSGRGLFLIHQCFDDVRWSRRGNRLQLACRRPINDADSPGL